MYKKYILFLVVIIAGVVMITVMRQEGSDNKAPFDNNHTENQPEQVNSTVTAEEETYFLIAEDEYLNLYNTDRNGSLRVSERIDFTIFPDDDVHELRKGITFVNETEAYKMMENYIN